MAVIRTSIETDRQCIACVRRISTCRLSVGPVGAATILNLCDHCKKQVIQQLSREE